MPLPEVLCADTARTPIVSVKGLSSCDGIAIAAFSTCPYALMHDSRAASC